MTIVPPESDENGKARRKVGAYAKLLANYASDDAIIDAGEAAELLFCRGLAFCATSDSDGFITDAQVVRYVGAGMRDAQKRAVSLVRVGLWERLDGGYLVRSWTKIHETAAAKGRRQKADRERKRKAAADSAQPSEPIPDGIQPEGVADSLSMTGHDSDTTSQSTTAQHIEGALEGDRYEPLRAVDATEPPEDEERCTRHPNGNRKDEPCRGCQRVEERKAKRVDRHAERVAAAEAEASRTCARCEGMGFVLDDNKMPTGVKCSNHNRRAS